MAFGTGSAGSAGYGTVDETSTETLNASATSVWVKCLVSSANSLYVNIPLLHGTDWLLLEPGDTFIGRFGYLVTVVVNTKALDSSAVATLSWGISAKLGS